MEPLVDTVIEDPRWEAIDLPARAEAAARAAFAELGLRPEGFTLCVMGCDDARIAELNGEFRQKGKPTNVLSWPSEERGADEPGLRPDVPDPGEPDDPEELGDIAIAWETCEREAVEQGKPMAAHVTHLVVHAVLHLLGYDHIDEADAELMEATEIAALARLGVADPY
ncbi:rRNA maturation RNase YbeY [Tabrizicola sp. J26]|uniref:rRNA maturation RNase YbeY n=1 Tax=Alitabrizicola rongguiensis TaxID=2909234 RepID=UPI001F26FBE9|nr:rRNA maturation RNase YbeY [Tabrizicola rongguiensis]MCF1708620.1 rRNA maturation RNase YbeY [Tabrizicola rongguiensis]